MKTMHERTHRRFLHRISNLMMVSLSILVMLAIAGCGEDGPTDYGPNGNHGNGGNGEPGPDEVWMEGHSFTPGNLEVEVGTTVTWTNQTDEVHTVTSGEDGEHDGEFNSGDVDPGETYSYEFTETGEFPYYCIPHVNAGMTGTITVVDDNGNGSDGSIDENDSSGENGDNGNMDDDY